MKLVYNHPVYTSFTVSALAAEWIEILHYVRESEVSFVSALAAEWIEIL